MSLLRMNAFGENEILTTFPSNITIESPNLTDLDFSFGFRFWFLLSFHVPSVICYVFVLIYILKTKTERRALHNHSVIVLLFISFCIVITDFSWTLNSFRYEGQVWPATSVFCMIWWLLDFGFYSACTVVLAWASFERHILIFHTNLIATKRRRILVHYFPLISILTYVIIFYTYAIFFPPCENKYDYTLPVCGGYPCYISLSFIVNWDLIVNGVIPTFLITLFNVGLVGRVLWQKRRLHQNWRRCRRMSFQLLSISALYLSINFPLMIVALVEDFGNPDWGFQAHLYLFFFSSLIPYLLPFICLVSLPGVWLKMKAFLRRNHRRVMPVNNIQANPNRQRETRM